MKKNKYIFVLVLLCTIGIVSFIGTFLYTKINNKNENMQQSDYVILTSCNPVYMACCNILEGVDGVTVSNLSQPTTGCLHDYTLTTEDMKLLSVADVLVINGAGMEGYLQDVIAAFPDLKIIDASKNVAQEKESDESQHHEHEESLDTFEQHESEESHEAVEHHEHEETHEATEHHEQEEYEDVENYESEESHEEGEHDHHHDINSHFWLSYQDYEKQIATIADALCELIPEDAGIISENAKDYSRELENELGVNALRLKESLDSSSVVILHDAYEYIAKDLDLDVVACMDLDEERQVSAGEIAQISQIITENQAKLILAERDYGSKVGELLQKQTGARVVYLQTLVHGSYQPGDYIKVMNENYNAIEQVVTR